MWMFPAPEWPPFIGKLTEHGQQLFDAFTSAWRAFNLELADFETTCRRLEPSASEIIHAFYAWRMDDAYDLPPPEESALLLDHRGRFRRERVQLNRMYTRLWAVLGASVAVEWQFLYGLQKNVIRTHDNLLHAFGVLSDHPEHPHGHPHPAHPQPARDNRLRPMPDTSTPTTTPSPDGPLMCWH